MQHTPANAADRASTFAILSQCRAASVTGTVVQQRSLARQAAGRIPDSLARDMAERRIGERLPRELLFRFSYVPFVIARLVWDRADTILDFACALSMSGAKKLSRAVRNLKADFDHSRADLIGYESQGHEEVNALGFDHDTAPLTHCLVVGLRRSIKASYPQLEPDYVYYLTAVHLCSALHTACIRYEQYQRRQVADVLRAPVGCILPKSFLALGPLIPQFAGDKPPLRTIHRPAFRLRRPLCRRHAADTIHSQTQ